MAGGLKIINDLGTMFVCQICDGLDFQKDVFETEKVGLILLLQRGGLVLQMQARLCNEGNALG